MSKEIQLFSEDKKYKCSVELSDKSDRFGCPDHSMMVLFEDKNDGIYVIAQAKDRFLETEKDHEIAVLKKALELATEEYLKAIDTVNLDIMTDITVIDFIEQAEKELSNE